MKQTSYHDRDYSFGQMMLSLRSAIGLTQAGLADYLGVSRRTVVDWEAGSKYPKADHLKSLIALAVEQRAFPAGHEADEIHTLWQAANQKLLLDEAWLTALLPTPQPAAEAIGSNRPFPLPVSAPRVDWGDALSIPTFYGRERELSLLTEWLHRERCRVVSVVGLGGIGKSSLVVRLMHQAAEQFEVVIWRSLRDTPNCETLLDDCLQVINPLARGQVLTNFEQYLSLLLESLRSTRVLLVLDNLEVLLEEGTGSGHLRPGYESYGRLLRQIAETGHQSCLLLTSREKPDDLVPYEGSRAPVRVLYLAPLDANACDQLLAEKNVIGSASERAQLIETYTGNPLALKIVAQTIADLFDGEVSLFLNQGEVIFGGVRQLLDEQFVRLSRLEQDVMMWLAILREPSTLDELRAVLVRPTASVQLLEAIEALHRRSLIERGQARASFTLQSVVLEYMTARLITDASNEIEQGQLERLIEYGLELARSREYVRQTQEFVIVSPILAHLCSVYSQQTVLEEKLLSLLMRLAAQAEDAQGYGPANLVVLLRLLRGDLRGIDLSRLVLRGLYLQSVEMQDSRLVNATIQDSVFTQTFDAMTSVAINRTGEYWAASSRRGEIRIWEAGGHILRQAWLGHADTIWALAFSPDGRILASGSSDSTHKLWDVASGSLLWSARHISYVSRVGFRPDGRVLATAGNDATVRLWDVASGTQLQILPHPRPLSNLAWSPNGRLLVSGDVEGGIRLWTMDGTAPIIQKQMEHTRYVDALVFAPDGQTLASGGWDGTVKLWEVASGRLLHTLAGHIGWVARLAWSPDGRILASSGSDQTILLWDVQQSGYRAVLKGHRADVYELAFTPDSHTLLSGSKDGTLRVWDVVTEHCVQVIQGYAAAIYDVDWSPDGTQLVSGNSDSRMTLWNVADGKPFQVSQEHNGVVFGVGWSSDGRWLASIETEHAIRLWDLRSGADFQFLRQLDRGGNYTYVLAWSSDGQYLASGSHYYGVMIWNVVTGVQTWIGRQSSMWFPYVAWSPDGRHLAGGGVDGTVYIWNVMEDALEQQLAGHHSMIRSLAWSPDGTYVASGSGGREGGELSIWNVLHGQLLHTLAGHSGIILALAWNSNGSVLISGGDDGTVRWWDTQTGECLRVREAHQGTVQALRRSPDGTKLASSGNDGAIMLWDLNSGDYLQTLRRDRPYERLNITGIRGLTEAQKAALLALGAIEANSHSS